jgi:hypothetical protein
MLIGDQVKMQPGFRNIVKPDRHVPELRWLGHELHLVSPTETFSPTETASAVTSDRAGEWRRDVKMQAVLPRHDGATKLSNLITDSVIARHQCSDTGPPTQFATAMEESKSA